MHPVLQPVASLLESPPAGEGAHLENIGRGRQLLLDCEELRANQERRVANAARATSFHTRSGGWNRFKIGRRTL